MVAPQFLFAASSILSFSGAIPVSPVLGSALTARGPPAYKIYGGNGTPEQGWPTEAQWLDYESMWAANYEVMMNKVDETGCLNQWGPNSEGEVAIIKSGIEIAASTSGLDHRFILATMMQESNGCVRIPTSTSPNEHIRNPGLFQDNNGDHTCNEDGKQIPCPEEQILGMINDGILGTASGEGLQQLVKQTGVDDVSKYYKALVLYNSGVLPESGNLGDGRATACYASDLANRLMGWTGIGRTCDPDTIGDFEGTPTESGSSEPSNEPDTTATSASMPTATSTSALAPIPSADNNEPSGKKFEGAPTNCNLWYAVQESDGCRSIEEAHDIAIGTMKKLNKGVNSKCGNLYNNVSYCLATSS